MSDVPDACGVQEGVALGELDSIDLVTLRCLHLVRNEAARALIGRKPQFEAACRLAQPGIFQGDVMQARRITPR